MEWLSQIIPSHAPTFGRDNGNAYAKWEGKYFKGEDIALTVIDKNKCFAELIWILCYLMLYMYI